MEVKIITNGIFNHEAVEQDLFLELGEFDVEPQYFNRQLLHYFSMYYLLPERYVKKHSIFHDLPRNPHLVLESKKWSKIFDSDQMSQLIVNVYSTKIWPHLGVRGYIEDYNESCLTYRICCSMLYFNHALKYLGYTVKYILSFPRNTDYVIGFLSEDVFDEIIAIAVPLMLDLYNFRPMIKVDKETRCKEDFVQGRETYALREFERKWYHTRTKHPMESLEALEEAGGEHTPLQYPDWRLEFEENITGKDALKRFTTRINPKDMQILKLRVDGYTYKEIAQKLDYKNHSGVIKRIGKIAQAYKQFEEKYS